MMDIQRIIENSYVPFSGHKSAAVVKSTEDVYFPGCRVENISYPLCISAVQNALFCCISEGHTPETLWADHTDEKLLSFWRDEFDVTTHPIRDFNNTDIHWMQPQLGEGVQIEKALVDLLGKALVVQSNFPVAAIIETDAGLFSGVNIECTAWNMGLCAERVAVSKALTYGSRKFKTLHIHTRDGEFSSPCGACRQVLLEHMPNRQIHLHHADHSESVHYCSDLLPHSFRSSSLSNQ